MTEKEWRDRFASQLDILIRKRGCTRREFAEDSGIPEKTLDHYIHGRRTPSAVSLMNLANALDCSIDKLAKFDEKIER